jgi:hypothetical protein
MTDDGAACLTGAVEHDLTLKLRRELLVCGVGNEARLVADRDLWALRKRIRHRRAGECRKQESNPEIAATREYPGIPHAMSRIRPALPFHCKEHARSTGAFAAEK